MNEETQIELCRLIRAGITMGLECERKANSLGNFVGAAVHQTYQLMLATHLKLALNGLSPEGVKKVYAPSIKRF